MVSGDALWAISERFYGDSRRYQQIADASAIPNPDLIQPSQVLTIPDCRGLSAATQSPCGGLRVRPRNEGGSPIAGKLGVETAIVGPNRT